MSWKEKLFVGVIVLYHAGCIFFGWYKEVVMFNFIASAGILIFDFLNKGEIL